MQLLTLAILFKGTSLCNVVNKGPSQTLSVIGQQSDGAKKSEKKRFLLLDIGENDVITRDQAIMILKVCKCK